MREIVLKRIIPADAGSTYMSQNTENKYEDHPRGCGEHEHYKAYMHITKGSSPRMRGAPKYPTSETAESRIIPADAGSTPCRSVMSIMAKDHPRGCGEHCLP